MIDRLVFPGDLAPHLSQSFVDVGKETCIRLTTIYPRRPVEATAQRILVPRQDARGVRCMDTLRVRVSAPA